MRNLLILCLVLLLANCNDDTPNNNFPACNDSTDPANDIAWISQAIDDHQNLTDEAHIICYELDGRLVFLVDYCLPCNDGYEVVDCEEEPICADNQSGTSSCDYFVDNAVNEIVIWQNY